MAEITYRATSDGTAAIGDVTRVDGDCAPWRPPEWLSALSLRLRQTLNEGGARHAFPGLVDPVERLIARACELQQRLNALARTHAATLDRLAETERRLAVALERLGEGSHTAHHCRCGDVAKTR